MKKVKKGTRAKSKKAKKIPKRKYTAKEIEKMIDNGEFDGLIIK